MNLGSISHRGTFNDCYALNENEIRINIKTGKDIKGINLIHGDPYVAGEKGINYWKVNSEPMTKAFELKYHNVWSAILEPEYKREQYYFEIYSNNEKVYFLENDFYTEEELNKEGIMYQYYKFPWINSSDIFVTPEWVKDTIWYQIMPDRFCRGGEVEKSKSVKPWKYENQMSHFDFYGGDLKGIEKKLSYLKELGISGIYLTPVLQSPSAHKYNVSDYYKIDCDFGNEEEMISLINKAHEMDIKVMVDAVFNHCSTEFKPWKDVVLRGKDSPYFNWFYVNSLPIKENLSSTKDGSYYSFAFEAGMPKLNTNNEEVINYFIDVLKHWALDWQVDGVRFDVGDEISHTFIKKIRYELKKVKPELFLLGEVWQDSAQYLQGDEYDSVMNYPFVDSINDFWINENRKDKDLMYAVNRCYSMYSEESCKVLFNFLDTHDIGRAFTRCGKNLDTLFQQLTLMLTLEGSPSIYYGTEIAMCGGHDPLNRKCMPWEDIEGGKYEKIINDFKKLIKVRNDYKECRSFDIKWFDTGSRLVKYEKFLKDSDKKILVLMNAENKELEVGAFSNILFSRKYHKGLLKAGGIVVFVKK